MLIDTMKTEGTRLVSAVQNSQRKKGLVASGRTGRTVRWEVERKRYGVQLRILGSRVFRWLQNGRGPNRSGRPGREQIAGLTEWVKLKGLPLSAVWPIAINQAKRGYRVPNKYNEGGVLSDIIGHQALQQTLLPAVAAAVRYDVVTKLLGK